MESATATLELLLSSILFGYMVNYFFSFDTWDKFHDQCLFNYWLVIDLFIMVTTNFYIYFVKMSILKSNLIKNFYAVIFIQEAYFAEKQEERE